MSSAPVTQERAFSRQAQRKVSFRMLETRFKEKTVRKKKVPNLGEMGVLNAWFRVIVCGIIHENPMRKRKLMGQKGSEGTKLLNSHIEKVE